MHTGAVTPELIARSVIAVPPLARRSDLCVHAVANATLVRSLEGAGVTTFLYGGNANFYHVSLGEYGSLLEMLVELGSADSWIVPSAGPAYGTLLDQAAILRRHRFPTAMVLPPPGFSTPAGVERGFRAFVDACGRPAVLYVKSPSTIDVGRVERLFTEGLVSWIKYAIVREDPAEDDYLGALVEAVDRRYIVSGIGEQPALIHLRDYGLGTFTSGCVCVAPHLSVEFLEAVRAGELAAAERVRRRFAPLEGLRNAISPIRVLHDAVTLAGIADMGPILPLLSNLEAADRAAVARATEQLLEEEARLPS